jgi:hypothetical protein
MHPDIMNTTVIHTTAAEKKRINCFTAVPFKIKYVLPEFCTKNTLPEQIWLLLAALFGTNLSSTASYGRFRMICPLALPEATISRSAEYCNLFGYVH